MSFIAGFMPGCVENHIISKKNYKKKSGVQKFVLDNDFHVHCFLKQLEVLNQKDFNGF